MKRDDEGKNGSQQCDCSASLATQSSLYFFWILLPATLRLAVAKPSAKVLRQSIDFKNDTFYTGGLS